MDPAKKGVYAMRPDEPTVLLVGEELWTAVPKNVAVLRNRTLVEVDRDKVTRLQIEGPKGTVAVAREGDQWKIVAPEALATDQVEVGAVLSRAARPPGPGLPQRRRQRVSRSSWPSPR